LWFALLGGIAAANAADCPGNPGAIGTSRVLRIEPRDYPLLGTIQYQETLPLADKEVVLTFDDGPMPPYTNRVLEVLAHECVKANYFIIGRMARGYPELLRRIHAEGHVIGTHSENHPLAFEKMPVRAVQAEIEQGIASTVNALGNRDAVAPFFRFPGLLRAEAVEGYLRSRGMVTWSADVAADDWKHITASEVVSRSIARLDARGKGILLLHDIQPATALALPHLLRELKRRGYKVVQVAPATAPAHVASAPRQNTATPPTRPAARDSIATPFPATTPAAGAARSEPPAIAAPITRAQPEKTPAELPREAAVAHAGPAPAPVQTPVQTPAQTPAPTPVNEPEQPPRRAAAAPVLDAATPDQQPVVRPLTPGFKPSHSESAPMKVADISETPMETPPGRQPADPWAMRAELRPPSR
jgi:peptidoglycan/xylan/chitin deacetylase (PgdA/CDA1 family)